eukprot:UN27225
MNYMKSIFGCGRKRKMMNSPPDAAPHKKPKNDHFISSTLSENDNIFDDMNKPAQIEKEKTNNPEKVDLTNDEQKSEEEQTMKVPIRPNEADENKKAAETNGEAVKGTNSENDDTKVNSSDGNETVAGNIDKLKENIENKEKEKSEETVENEKENDVEKKAIVEEIIDENEIKISSLEVGSRVDLKDDVGRFCQAKVISIEKNAATETVSKVKFTFDDFSAKYDTVIDVTKDNQFCRVKPVESMTKQERSRLTDIKKGSKLDIKY